MIVSRYLAADLIEVSSASLHELVSVGILGFRREPSVRIVPRLWIADEVDSTGAWLAVGRADLYGVLRGKFCLGVWCIDSRSFSPLDQAAEISALESVVGLEILPALDDLVYPQVTDVNFTEVVQGLPAVVP